MHDQVDVVATGLCMNVCTLCVLVYMCACRPGNEAMCMCACACAYAYVCVVVYIVYVHVCVTMSCSVVFAFGHCSVVFSCFIITCYRRVQWNVQHDDYCLHSQVEL